MWSPTAAENSILLKNAITHSPTRKKHEKKRKESTNTGKRGLKPAHLASYCGKQYIVNSTAVKRYVITTAAVVRIESDHTKKPQITKSLKRKKIEWVLI